MAIEKKPKKFSDTLVGGSLIGLASLINPALGNVLKGVTSVGDAIKSIGSSDATPDEKLMLQEFALRQFEAEVQDRASARQREAVVAASGGNDIMFKIVGGGVLLIFLVLISVLFFSQIDLGKNEGLVNILFGAVIGYVGNIVAYYYGSSRGSKQKTAMLGDKQT